jgi:hypothetical protein
MPCRPRFGEAFDLLGAASIADNDLLYAIIAGQVTTVPSAGHQALRPRSGYCGPSSGSPAGSWTFSPRTGSTPRPTPGRRRRSCSPGRPARPSRRDCTNPRRSSASARPASQPPAPASTALEETRDALRVRAERAEAASTPPAPKTSALPNGSPRQPTPNRTQNRPASRPCRKPRLRAHQALGHHTTLRGMDRQSAAQRVKKARPAPR